MFAITIWQPWATLIAAGAKPYEFRRWAAPSALRGQRIAVHAGARKVKREEIAALLYKLQHEGGAGTGLVAATALPLLKQWHQCPSELPLSSIVCTAVLGVPRKASSIFRGGVADSDRIDQHVFAWPMDAIERFEPPVPARGAQGWWQWTKAGAHG